MTGIRRGCVCAPVADHVSVRTVWQGLANIYSRTELRNDALKTFFFLNNSHELIVRCVNGDTQKKRQLSQ